ncbi:hypothetical protein ACFLR7_02175 [Acidobacteriota bacterium]
MTYPRYTPILLGLLLIVGCSPRSGEEPYMLNRPIDLKVDAEGLQPGAP